MQVADEAVVEVAQKLEAYDLGRSRQERRNVDRMLRTLAEEAAVETVPPLSCSCVYDKRCA